MTHSKTAGQTASKGKYSAVNQYLREINRYRLLTAEETERFVAMAQAKGGEWAGQQLVTGNLRLVVRVVMDFQRYWMDNFLDLIQEGNLGLTRAVLKFDASRGVKFSSYASYWIRAYVLKYIMDNCRLVRIGTSQPQRKLFYRLNKEKKRLEAEGIEPSTRELSQRLQVKESEVADMGGRLDNCDVSLDSPPPDFDSLGEHELMLRDGGIGVEDEVADHEFLEWFHVKLQTFTPSIGDREKVILLQRLMSDEPKTLTEIAEQFGVSRERIRQLESALLCRLRRLLGSEMSSYSHA